MRQAGYTELEKHAALHGEFTTRLKGFSRDYEAGAVALSVEVLDFLKDWLGKHIMGADRAYSGAMNSKGIC
jgi:hemerythrin-like metal-binding protein